jgi:hypothetical protein
MMMPTIKPNTNISCLLTCPQESHPSSKGEPGYPSDDDITEKLERKPLRLDAKKSGRKEVREYGKPPDRSSQAHHGAAAF